MSTSNFPENPQNHSQRKPFFYSEQFSLFDKWSTGIYLLLTVVVVMSYDRIQVSYAHMMILTYALMLQMFAYFFLYGNLRNFKCYLVWFGFSIIHLAMYFVMRDDRRLQSESGNPAALLRNTLILLLFFQLLRYISLKVQHLELVMPSKVGNIDDFDHRKITLTDRILFLAYAALCFALGYLSFAG